MQIAIADSEGRVNIWCDHNGLDEDGAIRFSVINGGWDGRFKDNMVYVEYTKSYFPGHLVWAGSAKGRDYNKAISWIQEQIDDPVYTMIPYEQIAEYNPPPYEYRDDEDDIPF